MADIQEIGMCKKCEAEALSCKYNFFEQDDLIIHAWEHKCANCGYRVTTGYRSDDEDLDFNVVPVECCPYCGRQGVKPSKPDEPS